MNAQKPPRSTLVAHPQTTWKKVNLTHYKRRPSGNNKKTPPFRFPLPSGTCFQAHSANPLPLDRNSNANKGRVAEMVRRKRVELKSENREWLLVYAAQRAATVPPTRQITAKACRQT